MHRVSLPCLQGLVNSHSVPSCFSCLFICVHVSLREQNLTDKRRITRYSTLDWFLFLCFHQHLYTLSCHTNMAWCHFLKYLPSKRRWIWSPESKMFLQTVFEVMFPLSSATDEMEKDCRGSVSKKHHLTTSVSETPFTASHLADLVQDYSILVEHSSCSKRKEKSGTEHMIKVWERDKENTLVHCEIRQIRFIYIKKTWNIRRIWLH